MNLILRSGGALALLLLAGTAAAQTAGTDSRNRAQDRQQATPSDQSPGGRVEQGGIADTAPQNYLWDRLDTNEDDFISPAEAAMDDGLARRFRVLDTNNDLKLDSTEFSAYEMAPSTKQNKRR